MTPRTRSMGNAAQPPPPEDTQPDPTPPASRRPGHNKLQTQPTADSPPESGPVVVATPALASKALRMSYRIARGEQGVLTFEPYKTALLPLWRFRTADAARASAAALCARFEAYRDEGDLVGMDMARKFIQMGMTRAGRYANHKGGRKYDYDGAGGRTERERGGDWEGRAEKVAARDIFRGVWERVRADEKYKAAKEEFVIEQKEWDRGKREG